MTRRITFLLILSLTLVAILAMTALAAKSPVTKRVIDPRVNRVTQYVLPYPDESPMGSSGTSGDVGSKGSLGRMSSGESPGVYIGDTWYDYQHNGSMGRMIDIQRGSDGFQVVHMDYMRLPENNAGTRRYVYQYYDSDPGFAALGPIPPSQIDVSAEWAGYVGIAALGDNSACVGGHEKPAGTFQAQFYWNYWDDLEFFGDYINRVPDSVAAYGGTFGQSVIWPKFRYQETAPDTVLHVIAQVSNPNAGDPQAIYYFRKVGVKSAGEWDYPPLCIDTIYDISQDVACSKTTGKVALVWTANLVGDDGAANAGLSWPDCAYNSGTSPFVQLDNDIQYMISNDQGFSWLERKNVTCNVDGEAGFRPYTDLSALITTDENLHIVWSGRVWPADATSGGFIGLNCRIFHWSEDITQLRTVHNADWHQTNCNGGAWQMNVAKMSISECAGRLYVVFTQFNDIPAGIEDDCAQRGVGENSADPVGSANGEIYMCVSADSGLTWDLARNLTDSRTSGCDSATGTGGRCESDHWASMARFGTEMTNGVWAGGEGEQLFIDPGTIEWPHDNDYWLDLQWINDPVPGGVVQDEGGWFLADVLWARIACVPIVPAPNLVFSPREIAYPAYTKFGTWLDTPLVIENSGNVGLAYTITLEEDNGPAGWLAESGNDGAVPSGENNVEIGTLTLNAEGKVGSPKIEFEPTVELRGRVLFTGEFPTAPDTLPITFYVADTLYTPTFDTLATASFSLAVASSGNYGNNGLGQVNLDWYAIDCDHEDSAEYVIPGNSEVYLYDGSSVLTRVIPHEPLPDPDDPLRTLDTIGAWAIFQDGFLSDNGTRQVGPHTATSTVGNHDEFYSGPYSTSDTSIIFEKTWYAPGSSPDAFIIQCLKVYSSDTMSYSGLAIGEAIDWDIPSDTGSRNTCGSDAGRNLIYQMGYEYNAWDDTLECMDNNLRVGGIAFLEKFEKNGYEMDPDTLIVWTALSTTYNGGLADLQTNIDAAIAWYNANTPGTFVASSTDFVGAYSMTNDTFVYPRGGFVAAELHENMNTLNSSEQYVCWTTTQDEADLHSVMTFVNDFYLRGEATDHDEDGVGDWHDNCDKYNPDQADSNEDGVGDACDGCCQGVRGNANGDDNEDVNISDITYLVDYLFGTPLGPAPPCKEEGNANGDENEDVNISDITYLVDYLYGTPLGPAPPACP
jgi:hypothetical protein